MALVSRSATKLLPRPEFLPPFFGAGRSGGQSHLRANAGEIPAGEFSKLARFVFLPSQEFAPVFIRGRTRRLVAVPWMAQHVTRLEIIPVGVS